MNTIPAEHLSLIKEKLFESEPIRQENEVYTFSQEVYGNQVDQLVYRQGDMIYIHWGKDETLSFPVETFEEELMKLLQKWEDTYSLYGVK